MLLTAKDPTPFKKEYLPGYTGFVPHRSEMFGMTSGDINKLVIASDT